MDQTRAHNYATNWGDEGTYAVQSALKQYGVSIVSSRWPYTYSADYVRTCLMYYIESRSEAAHYTTRLAQRFDISRDFLCCLFAIMHLSSVPDGMPAMFAIANDPIICEVFKVAYALGLSPKTLADL